MYEFVCDRIIPGCNHTETAATEEEARLKARQHLKDHHGMESLDDSQRIRIDMAILGIHR
jgi:predicted small metal-binding protein